MAKFSKFCSQSFHRHTDRHVMFTFRVKFSRWEIGEIARCLPWQKKFHLAFQLSLLRRSRSKSARASIQKCTQSAPDLIKIGSLSGELYSRKVNPIFGWSLASTRIIMIDANARICVPEPEECASVQLTTGRSGIHLNSSEHVQCQRRSDWPHPLDADSGPSRRHHPPNGELRSAQPTAETAKRTRRLQFHKKLISSLSTKETAPRFILLSPPLLAGILFSPPFVCLFVRLFAVGLQLKKLWVDLHKISVIGRSWAR